MRLSIALLCAPLVASLTIVPRQTNAEQLAASRPPPDLTVFLNETWPYKVEHGNSTMQMKDAKNMKLYFGPLDLLPASEAAKEVNPIRMETSGTAFQFIAKGFPDGSIVLRTNTTVEYADGKPADISSNVHNHHIMFLDASKPSTIPLQCVGAEGRNMRPVSTLAGASADTGPTFFSDHAGNFSSGYHLAQDSKIMMTAELVNYNKATKQVFIVVELDYIDGNVPNMTDTVLSLVSVSECDPYARNVVSAPAGQKKFELKSAQMIVAIDGYLLTRRGHLHNGGKNIVLKLNGRTICDSTANYDQSQSLWSWAWGKQESLSSMGECYEPIRVERGDAINIEAYYDLDAHPLRPTAHGSESEVMGLMTFAFAQDDTGTAKSSPSSSPE